MWCKTCNRKTDNKICEICGATTVEDVPVEVYWCSHCNIPIIKAHDEIHKDSCPLCKNKIKYLSTDLRPVFPEERLLLEILKDNPLKYINDSVWCVNNRYYINGEAISISFSKCLTLDIENIQKKLDKYKEANKENSFEKYTQLFAKGNQERLNYLKDESFSFVKEAVKSYPSENIVISFSGGKDSTVVADIVVRALSNPGLMHIFGNTTLEFPLTYDYVERFRKNNPKIILKMSKNKDQKFYDVCEDIGPPSRVMRWCCTMFKTGPITRILTNLYRDKKLLTFYGIRKCESVSRSKYNRIEDNAESIKIKKQVVASPIFYWKDIDIWLYIIAEDVDFNDAYRLGYDRVGCWCCPNNNDRAAFLAKIYMPEESTKWRNFLVNFAKNTLGKPDAEVYVDTGKWKARQGGNGLKAAEDVKIKYSNCTAEDNAKIYQLNKPITEDFYTLFTPFGKVSKELGRKLLNEVIVLDLNTNVPIISLQPFNQQNYEYSIKIKTMNVQKHDDLQRMIGYQIRKYNSCRKCLKCESVCKYGAITINSNTYRIDAKKCRHCKMCVTAKYLDGGCLMAGYLVTKAEKQEISNEV